MLKPNDKEPYYVWYLKSNKAEDISSLNSNLAVWLVLWFKGDTHTNFSVDRANTETSGKKQQHRVLQKRRAETFASWCHPAKALRWPIKYMQAQIPSRFICNVNTWFLLYQFGCLLTHESVLLFYPYMKQHTLTIAAPCIFSAWMSTSSKLIPSHIHFF